MKLYPILKIQKIFRGWLVRSRLKKEMVHHKTRLEITQAFFEGWKEWAKKMGRVRRALKGKRKEYLMWEGREMRGREMEQRMIELGRRAAERVAQRHVAMRHEYVFDRALRGNWLRFRSLYQELEL